MNYNSKMNDSNLTESKYISALADFIRSQHPNITITEEMLANLSLKLAQLNTVGKNAGVKIGLGDFSDTESEEYDYMTEEYVALRVFFYSLYTLIFLLGISGNTLVCFVVFRNKS